MPYNDVPTVAGPFAFLANLGAAGGAAFEQAEKARQQKVKEAADAVKTAIDLRKLGYLGAEAFNTPEMKKAYGLLGISDDTESQPTPGELKDKGQRKYLQDLENQPAPVVNIPFLGMGGAPTGATQRIQLPKNASTLSDEQRLALGLPKRSEITGEKVESAKGGRQLGVFQQGTEAQQNVLAGTPSAETASAAESLAREPLYTSTADRSAGASLTTLGGDINAIAHSPKRIQQWRDAAWELAQKDARSQGLVLNKEVTRPYIDAAIDAQLRANDRIQAQVAVALSRGAVDQNQKYIALLQAQQKIVQDAIDTKEKEAPDALVRLQANNFKKRMAAAGNDPAEFRRLQTDPEFESERAAWLEVNSYDAALMRLYDERAGLGDISTGNITQKLPNRGNSGVGVESRNSGGLVPSDVSPGGAQLNKMGVPQANVPQQPSESGTTNRLQQEAATLPPLSDQTMRMMASFIRTGKSSLQALQEQLDAGKISAADAATVKSYVDAGGNQ